MSQQEQKRYSTGELAKLCGVSVRTVQYYDTRGILPPSELSEGGRRLYTEADFKQMQIICFLKDLGFSLENIGKLLSEDNAEEVMVMLIEKQQQALQEELEQRQQKLLMLQSMKRALRSVDRVSVQTLGDVAQMVKHHNKRKKVLIRVVAVGVVMDIIEVGLLVYGIRSGNFFPYAIGFPILLGMGFWISYYYYSNVAYICPACHRSFYPKFRESFFANHTPNTRKLKCPHCKKVSFCVEIGRDREEK